MCLSVRPTSREKVRRQSVFYSSKQHSTDPYLNETLQVGDVCKNGLVSRPEPTPDWLVKVGIVLNSLYQESL